MTRASILGVADNEHRLTDQRVKWRPKAQPENVRVHDFLIKGLGRVVPYGIYDLAADVGWVSVGIDHDTAAFAVQTIRRWWQEVGRVRYPKAKRLVITADGGGSNGFRLRLWKRELQRLANEIGIGDARWVAADLKLGPLGRRVHARAVPEKAESGIPTRWRI